MQATFLPYFSLLDLITMIMANSSDSHYVNFPHINAGSAL
jgi:hypothetical protein